MSIPLPTVLEQEQEQEEKLPDILYTRIRRTKGYQCTILLTLEDGETDKDSDGGDDPSSEVRHLLRRLLGGTSEVELIFYTKNNLKRRRNARYSSGRGRRKGISRRHVIVDLYDNELEEGESQEGTGEGGGVEEEEEEGEEEVMKLDWTRDDPGIVIPLYQKKLISNDIKDKFAEFTSACEFYKHLCNDEYVDFIITKPKNFAISAGVF